MLRDCGFVRKKGALFHPPASSSQSVGQLLTQLRQKIVFILVPPTQPSLNPPTPLPQRVRVWLPNKNARNMNITSRPPNPPVFCRVLGSLGVSTLYVCGTCCP